MSTVDYLGLHCVGTHHLLAHALFLYLAFKNFLHRVINNWFGLSKIVYYLSIIVLSIV
jgi:hypothetical protein